MYLRFGAARLMPNATLVNTVGGCEGDANSSRRGRVVPRYCKAPVDWKTEILGDGIGQIRAWLNSRLLTTGPSDKPKNRLPSFVVLDVLVPSVRCG